MTKVSTPTQTCSSSFMSIHTVDSFKNPKLIPKKFFFLVYKTCSSPLTCGVVLLCRLKDWWCRQTEKFKKNPNNTMVLRPFRSFVNLLVSLRCLTLSVVVKSSVGVCWSHNSQRNRVYTVFIASNSSNNQSALTDCPLNHMKTQH